MNGRTLYRFEDGSEKDKGVKEISNDYLEIHIKEEKDMRKKVGGENAGRKGR